MEGGGTTQSNEPGSLPPPLRAVSLFWGCPVTGGGHWGQTPLTSPQPPGWKRGMDPSLCHQTISPPYLLQRRRLLGSGRASGSFLHSTQNLKVSSIFWNMSKYVRMPKSLPLFLPSMADLQTSKGEQNPAHCHNGGADVLPLRLPRFLAAARSTPAWVGTGSQALWRGPPSSPSELPVG